MQMSNDNVRSWYPSSDLSGSQYKYLKSIQNIWKVLNADKRWVPYKLQPHQIEWHANDVAILREKAKSRIATKSRNTSFTTSACISNLMAVPEFPEQVIPFVRLNQTRANDLIADCKNYIRHMTPIRKNGALYPFDPRDVEMSKVGSIKFPNGVEFRAFPATASSAETIRGLRIVGSAGILDESNFMRDYLNLYIATRDTTAGVTEDGQKIFQMNIGTTLKGRATPFKLWYDRIITRKIKSIQVFSWPVLNPTLVDYKKPFNEQENLTPIVYWHNLSDLWDKYLEDDKKFLEEYMCVTVDDDTQFYPTDKIIAVVNSELKNYSVPENKEGLYYGGADPAGEGTDMFAVVAFETIYDEESQTTKHIQRHLHYESKTDLPDMQEYLEKFIQLWNFKKFRIDANMIGYQIAKYLQKKFPGIVEPIRGRISIKSKREKESVPFKEFLHTNQKSLMINKKIELISDEVQIRHFTFWNYNYESTHDSEYGHGDTTIANGLALLPENWQRGAPSHKEPIVANSALVSSAVSDNSDTIKDKITNWHNNTPLKTKLKMYKKRYI